MHFTLVRCGAIVGLLWALALFGATPAAAQHLDAEMEDEHNAMLNLVPTNQATRTAVADGNWSNGAVWSGGSAPGAGDKVYIPVGRTVTYDVNSSAAVRWLRVEGKLAFSRTANTALSIDTIVVNVGGEWEQGTVASPIPANYTSNITFTDAGAIDTGVDTYFMGRGLLSHGKVRICGATTTTFLRTNSGLSAGATGVNLQTTPANWKSGDQIIVTGMKIQWNGSEYVGTTEAKSIAGISGASLTLNSGLTYARTVDYPGFNLYPVVSNLTRNITFRSANVTDASRKGHVMLMHNKDVDIRYAAFVNLGRSRKDIDITNSPIDQFPPGTNPRARYALHFHRNGKDDPTVTPSLVKGCAVVNPTSWGYVNHDSYVNFEDNVCYNAYGAAFITENGAEIGAFRRNLAAVVGGRGFIKDGTGTHDLARNGNGFWFQGGNVVVEDNIAANIGVGYTYFERTGVDLGESQKIYRAAMIDPDAAGGNDYILAADTPMFHFKRNTSIGCYQGMFNVDNEINGLWPTENLLEDYTDLNSQADTAVRIEYYRNLRVKNVKILRDSTMPPDPYSGVWAISANHLVDHLYPWETRSTDWIDGLYVRGFTNAVDNDDGNLGGSSPERIAQHEVLSGGIDFVGPGSAFANTSVYYGMPLLTYTNTVDVPVRPTFSPAAGRYPGAQTVTISSSAGTTIYYVTGPDGYTVPSVESRLAPGQWQQYTGPVTVNTGQKLIAIAYKNGKRSRIRNGVYLLGTALTPVATPIIDPASGTYTSAQTVTMTTSTSGATIRYTTDGSNPTSSSGTVYSAGFSVAVSQTVKALAYKAGMSDSGVATANYTINLGSGSNNGTGLRGTYFNNKTLTAPSAVVRTDATVNFDFGNGSYASGQPTDNFSARWDGQVEAPVSGSYAFTTNSDDGVRLTVNGQQIINNWTDHGPTDNSATITLTAGTKYTIVMEFYESGGGAVAKLDWAYPGQTRQNVPQSRLYPATGGGSAPSAPTGLSATAGNAQATLSWTGSTGATSYNVKRSTTGGGPYTTVNSPTGTSYTNTGLTNGTTYYYVVTAVNANGESGNSNQASATPTAGTTIVTVNPTDDTDTQSDSASGTNAEINSSQWNTIFVRFDFTSVTGTVTNAKFRIYKPNTSSNLGCTAAQTSTDVWAQSNRGALPGVGAAIQTITAANGVGYIEFDVTALIQSRMSGSKIVSFALNTNSGGWTGFQTKEGANKPQLVITK